MSEIPIRNIYYLLCYAWDHVQERDLVEAGEHEFKHVEDLLGHVLASGTARLVSRGLSRSYVADEGEIAGIRGKLDLGRTIARRSHVNGRAYCQFDEFHHDILPNQILKATVALLLRVPGVADEIRARLRAVYLHLGEVSLIQLSHRDFGRVQIHRNVRLYDFMLRVCRLIYDGMVVDEATGHARFHDFIADEARMGQVFEEFIFNFYRREQKEQAVNRPHIGWFERQGSERDLRHLPVMRTDVVLRRPDRTLVVDAKFYRQPLKGWFTTEKVRSGHLYQLFAYLENFAPVESAPVAGLLVYPAGQQQFAFEYRLKGHAIRVVTLDLSQEWTGIHRDLLQLCRD